MMHKRTWSQVFALSAVMALFLFSAVTYAGMADSKLQIAATIFPFADWAKQIGGDKVEVICLLPPGATPHTYELTIKDIKALSKVNILIYNGMGLDDWVSKSVETSSNKGLIILSLADKLPLAPMPDVLRSFEDEDHDHGHEHAHQKAVCGMWLDPMRAVFMVNLITDAIVQADPDNKLYYRERAKRYWGQLDRIDRQYRRELLAKDGGVICFHDAFVYLFRRYNIDVYGIVEPYPGKEPSVEYLRRLSSRVAKRPLRYVLSEPQLSGKPAQVLAEHLGVGSVSVDPFGGEGVKGRDSYISMMSYNLNQLTGKVNRGADVLKASKVEKIGKVDDARSK
jgi:zinc transport system substrate-binding protein